MDLYITKEALLALGINLGDQDIDSLLTHLNETVEERIGAEITESLSDEQLQELIDIQDNATDEDVGNWIAEHVPDYKEIVQDNIDIVIGELVDGADAVNEAV